MDKVFLFSFFFILLNNNKNIVIDPSFKSHNTELTVTINENPSEILKSSVCNDKSDSLKVTISNIGLGGSSLRIAINDEITPKIVLWSDYKEYNNEYTTEIELESYDLTLNKSKFKVGDTIRGHIKCKSETSKYVDANGFIEMEGSFLSIVGKTILMRKDGKKFILDTKEL